MTHLPFNPMCIYSRDAKLRAAAAKRKDPALSRRPENFGDVTYLDHTVLNEEEKGDEDESNGLMIMDWATDFEWMDPLQSKSTKEAVRAIKYYEGTKGTLKQLYSDCAPELKAAAAKLELVHATSTPYRPKSNTRVELRIQHHTRCARAALLASGLPHRFWPHAVRHCCTSRNVSRRPDGSSTPWELRHGEKFKGKMIPFGAAVTYLRPDKGQRKGAAKKLKYDPSGSKGVFLGWHMAPGIQFRGDYLIADLDSFLNDQSEIVIYRVRNVREHESVNFPIRIAADRAYADALRDRERAALDAERDKRQPGEADVEICDGDAVAETVGEGGDDVVSAPLPDQPSDQQAILAPEADDHHDDQEERPSSSTDPPPPPLIRWQPRRGAGRPDYIEPYMWRRIQYKDRTRIAEEHRRAQAAEHADADVGAESKDGSALFARALSASGGAQATFMIEVCTDKNSMLGIVGEEQSRKVHRITEIDDFRRPSTLNRALAEVDKFLGADLWISLPCTPWSQWQRLNMRKCSPATRARILRERADGIKMIKHALTLARKVRQNGGYVAMEWPRFCSGWARGEVRKLLRDMTLTKANFHGCAVGLESKTGKPLLKPWTVATDSPELEEALNGAQCTRDHTHLSIEGAETGRSAHYPRMMCEMIHNAFKKQHENQKEQGKDYEDDALNKALVSINYKQTDHDQRHVLPELPVPPALAALRPPTLTGGGVGSGGLSPSSNLSSEVWAGGGNAPCTPFGGGCEFADCEVDELGCMKHLSPSVQSTSSNDCNHRDRAATPPTPL